MNKLEAIKARAQAATPAPWEMEGSPCYGEAKVVAPCPCCGLIGDNMFHWDADFIAHARADIPALLAVVEAAMALESARRESADALSRLLDDIQNHEDTDVSFGARVDGIDRFRAAREQYLAELSALEGEE